MKIMKIDACNFENNLFDDKSIIVNCTLDLDNKSEYQIRAMINNECIDYSFIDINVAHEMCELLEIILLKLNKSREMKNYDERRNKNITHAIYSFMTIQDHTKISIFMMIIKLDQHSIILKKSWMKKHEVSYHEHDDSISFCFDHCSHLEAFNHSYSNKSNRIQTKKKISSRKKTFLINQRSSRTKKQRFFSKKSIIQKWFWKDQLNLTKD